jgi:hypothetical protein
MTKKNTAAILVGINGGMSDSAVYAHQLGEMFQHKTRTEFKGEVPFVTYAEESAFNSGLALLMYGDVVLANPFSQVGNIGFRMTPWMLKAFMHDTARV